MPQDGTVAPVETPEQQLRNEYEYEPAGDDLSLTGHAPLNMPAGETPSGPPRNAAGQFVPADDTLTPSSHPARLIAEAAKFGVEGAESLSTPDLREAIRDAKLDYAVSFRQSLERSDVADATGRTTTANGSPGAESAAGTAPALESPAEPVIDWGEGENGVKLTETDWPPLMRWAAKQAALIPKLVKEIDELKKGHADVQQYVAGERTQKFVSTVDQGFADAGPGFARIVGKGAEMDVKSPEYRTRMAVLASLRAEPPAKGTPPAKAIAERTKELFSHLAAPQQPADEPTVRNAQPVPPARVVNGQQPRITEEQWRQANTAIPGGRRPPPVQKGPAAAVKAVAGYLETHDLGLNEADPEMPD